MIKKLFLTALPAQAIAMGLPAVNELLDSVIVGNYLGENALAVMGFVRPLSMFVVALSGIISTGTQMVCGRQIGKGDKKGIISSFNTMLFLCVLIGLLLTTACMLVPEKTATLLGAVGDLNGVTADYLKGIGIGMVFSLLVTCLLTLAQVERMGKLTTVVMIIMFVFNVGGNIFNAFYLHMGLFGAGLFLSIGNIASVLVVLPYMLIKGKIFRFSPSSVRFSAVLHILRQGSPYAVLYLSNILQLRVLNHFIFKVGGTVGMAAISVAGNISTSSISMLESGYFNAGGTIASVLVGHRDSSSLRDLPKVMLKSAGYFFLIIYILIFIAAKPLALLFGADGVQLDTYVTVIRLYNLWAFFSPIGSPVRCIYQAMGRIRLSNIMALIGSTLFPIAYDILIAQTGKLSLVCMMPTATEAFNILVYSVVFIVLAHRLPRGIHELCYIPSSVSAPRENRFKATIENIDDVTIASERIVDFCKSKNLPSKTAYYCGLCVEEIAADAVNHRFVKNKSTIDLRAIYENGSLFIMFRDDCPHFDVGEWLELCAPADASRSLGIKMVKNLQHEMNYVNVMGLNVLNITIKP